MAQDRCPAADGSVPPEAPPGCAICPRLADHRAITATEEPSWFNGAVPSFGDPQAQLLIVGLAPGRGGANRTGRPFTGDYAGDLLYETLATLGLSQGRYAARADDGLTLRRIMITNAVRCLPPQNKPSTSEIASCRPFLSARIAALPELRAIVTLGKIAHDSTLRALGHRPAALPFAHGAQGEIGGISLHTSYHCSRYNTQTRRLTPAMFISVMRAAAAAAGLAASTR
ncbi:MAG: uracil-DNA glycosylase [Pseudomonadota bacterium]